MCGDLVFLDRGSNFKLGLNDENPFLFDLVGTVKVMALEKAAERSFQKQEFNIDTRKSQIIPGSM